MTNLEALSELYPQLKKPRWRPDLFFWLLLVATFLIIIGMVIGQAKAEEPNWEQLVNIVIQIESGGNPNAYNKQSGAIGLMQITNIVLQEFYQHNKIEDIPFTSGDLRNPEFNKYVGLWYLKRIWYHYLPHYKLEQNISNLCIAYNFGIGNLVKYRQGKVKLPKETRNYLLRYKSLEKKGR